MWHCWRIQPSRQSLNWQIDDTHQQDHTIDPLQIILDRDNSAGKKARIKSPEKATTTKEIQDPTEDNEDQFEMMRDPDLLQPDKDSKPTNPSNSTNMDDCISNNESSYTPAAPTETNKSHDTNFKLSVQD